MSSRVKEKVLSDFCFWFFNVVPVVVQPYVEACLTFSGISGHIESSGNDDISIVHSQVNYG